MSKENLIAIDCGSLIKQRGIASFIENLITGLEQIDSDKKILLILPKGYKKKIESKKDLKNISFISFFYFNQIIWDLIIVPLIAYYKNASHIIYTSNTGGVFIPRCLKIESSVVIHDVSFLKGQKISPKPEKIYQKIGYYYRKININKIAQYSKFVFTVSEFAKEDISNELNVDKDKIFVCYNSLKKQFFKKPNQFNKKEKTIIVVTGDTPQKNLDFFINVIIKYKDSFEQWNIKIIGSNKKLNIDNVMIIPFMKIDELLEEYNKASILIIPSIYESFSIPIIEAMSREVLVVASNKGAIPEISNNFSILFDPMDEISLLKAFKEATLKVEDKKLLNKASEYARSYSSLKQAEIILKNIS